MLGINTLYAEVTHASLAIVELLGRWAQQMNELPHNRAPHASADGNGSAAKVMREEDFEYAGESYLDRMAVDTLFLASHPVLPPPQHTCTTQLCSVGATP